MEKKRFLARICVAALLVLPASASFAAEFSPTGSNYGNYLDDPRNAGMGEKIGSYLDPKDVAGGTQKDADGRSYYTEDLVKKYQEAYNAKNPDSKIGVDGKIGDETRGTQKAAEGGSSSSGPSINKKGTIADPEWTFSVSSFSPSSKRWTAGSKGNIENILRIVTDLLLVAIATLAALLIAVAGLRMALSSGNSDEASKGKTMLRFNLMALAISLMSYVIVSLLSWIISAS